MSNTSRDRVTANREREGRVSNLDDPEETMFCLLAESTPRLVERIISVGQQCAALHACDSLAAALGCCLSSGWIRAEVSGTAG